MRIKLSLIFLAFFYCSCEPIQDEGSLPAVVGAEMEKSQQEIIQKANNFLQQGPTPLTMFVSERSAGGIHDFYSEGDYWWENPEDPDGPYIRRDGLSNPSNFLEHRIAMRNLNEWVSTLVAAYEISGDAKYADHALKHLNAFFIDPATLMNPSLLYAQAIKGRHTGRGIGIIDTIHLIEVAKCLMNLYQSGYLKEDTYSGYKSWFDAYATWMNTHPYGIDEKDHGNNHSTWWAAQLAAFGKLADRDDLVEIARSQFKKLLSAQMADNGSFPDELDRTKPYNYSLFNLEGYSVIAEMASSDGDLWVYEAKNGSLQKAWEYMLPYIQDKSTWAYPPDVSHFDEIPIRSVGLLLAGLAYDDQKMIETWVNLDPTKKSEEVKRNFPLWYPQNWL